MKDPCSKAFQVKMPHFLPTPPPATPGGFWHLSCRASNMLLKMAYKEAALKSDMSSIYYRYLPAAPIRLGENEEQKDAVFPRAAKPGKSVGRARRRRPSHLGLWDQRWCLLLRFLPWSLPPNRVPPPLPRLSGYELPCHLEGKMPTINEVRLITGCTGATFVPSTARVAGSPPGQQPARGAHRTSPPWRITVSFVRKVGPVVL